MMKELFFMGIAPVDGHIYRKTIEGNCMRCYAWSMDAPNWTEISEVRVGSVPISKEQADLTLNGGKIGMAELLSQYYHAGQVDKAGKPYSLHPAAVAAKVDDENAKIAAFLHDTLEDTAMEPDTIKLLFGDEILDAVKVLTRKDDESYEDFIKRCGENPLARKVKLADLEHNMDLSRLPNVTEKDRRRAEKYRKSAAYLHGLQHS